MHPTSFRIGDMTIHRIVESDAPFMDAMEFLPSLTPEVLDEHRSWLQPASLEPTSGKLVFCFQSYVVRTSHHVVLIDSCVGNDKNRPTRPSWHMKTDQTYMSALASAGIAVEDIDYVMCTHLHPDHVGWNTRLDNGHWVPTFPNARYVFTDRELAHWTERNAQNPIDCIVDSVLPVVAANRAERPRVGPSFATRPSTRNRTCPTCWRRCRSRSRLASGRSRFPSQCRRSRITLAIKHKDRRNPAHWKGMKFAIPFDYSMHNYLRYYLAENGLDPDTDVQLRSIPPPEMFANLRADNIDGFLAPDNICQRAIYDGVGFMHMLKEIWDGHPCCSFAASREFITGSPASFAALTRAIVDATAYAAKAENRKEIAEAIAPANYINAPALRRISAYSRIAAQYEHQGVANAN
jgi:hypothetical protein